MKDSGVEWLGEIPAGWEVKSRMVDRLPRRPSGATECHGTWIGRCRVLPDTGVNSIVDYVDRWLFDEESLVLLGEDGAPFFDRAMSVAFRACS